MRPPYVGSVKSIMRGVGPPSAGVAGGCRAATLATPNKAAATKAGRVAVIVIVDPLSGERSSDRIRSVGIAVTLGLRPFTRFGTRRHRATLRSIRTKRAAGATPLSGRAGRQDYVSRVAVVPARSAAAPDSSAL